jgi:hypothetical protein
VRVYTGPDSATIENYVEQDEGVGYMERWMNEPMTPAQKARADREIARLEAGEQLPPIPAPPEREVDIVGHPLLRQLLAS